MNKVYIVHVLLTASLFATIWIALVLFVAAEAGRSRFAGERGPARWARPALGLGAVLLVAHVLLALHMRYFWDHELAVRETARQAATVYGFEWRGNIFVSYAFVLLWCAEVVRWRQPLRHSAASSLRLWAWRGFFFVIIANGAIVFASSSTARIGGGLLVAALVWAWWPASAQDGAHDSPVVYP